MSGAGQGSGAAPMEGCEDAYSRSQRDVDALSCNDGESAPDRFVSPEQITRFRPTERFFKVTLAYDGKDFRGWQRQREHRTVQGEVEAALKEIFGVPLHAAASGRTDAGVHAIGQVVSFNCETKLDAGAIMRALNSTLPFDIFVHEVVDAPFGFYALRDTVKKRYRYVIQDGPRRDIFAKYYSWYVRPALDEHAMQRGAQHLLGTHDFAAFESTGSQRLCTERTILDISVERRRIDLSDRVVIEVEADGFLYNMVRNIAGTLVQIGRHKEPEDWPLRILASQDRRQAGAAAPPQGLFLVKVDVDESLWARTGQGGGGADAETPQRGDGEVQEEGMHIAK